MLSMIQTFTPLFIPIMNLGSPSLIPFSQQNMAEVTLCQPGA